MTQNLNLSTGLVATGTPLAVRGYDLVSYTQGNTPLTGKAEFAVVHQGATYYFADAANAEIFTANPSRYLPSFGGFCAYGASVAKKFDGDPTIYKIADGRLHLNLNREIHAAFLADVPGAVAKADAAWVTIAEQPVASL